MDEVVYTGGQNPDIVDFYISLSKGRGSQRMELTTLDWVVIAAYFLLNLGIGFFYMKRASGDVGEFFLSGRSVPWWLAGTSMVATTFGADT
ncbi:MAG TPA: hypothetical protein VF214_09570, partial [Edaphobacter sp.]